MPDLLCGCSGLTSWKLALQARARAISGEGLSRARSVWAACSARLARLWLPHTQAAAVTPADPEAALRHVCKISFWVKCIATSSWKKQKCKEDFSVVAYQSFINRDWPSSEGKEKSQPTAYLKPLPLTSFWNQGCTNISFFLQNRRLWCIASFQPVYFNFSSYPLSLLTL